jgi:hypothetical protein
MPPTCHGRHTHNIVTHKNVGERVQTKYHNEYCNAVMRGRTRDARSRRQHVCCRALIRLLADQQATLGQAQAAESLPTATSMLPMLLPCPHPGHKCFILGHPLERVRFACA